MTQKNKEELEQAEIAKVCHLPYLWRSLWTECIKQGFTQIQTMELLKTFIRTNKLEDK